MSSSSPTYSQDFSDWPPRSGEPDELARRPVVFESPLPYDPGRVQAAAIYCSDGRYGEQMDDLLHTGLQLPRYDRLAVPGGAACLAGHFPTYREEEGLVEQLRFLITAHQLKRIVLIAHQSCAYYTHRLRMSPLQLESRQFEDLLRAAQRLRGISRDLKVEAYFARVWNRQVAFEVVEVGSSN